MERKRIKEVAIAAGVLLALLLVVWWVTRDSAPSPVIQKETGAAVLPVTNTQKEPPVTINPADVPQVQEVSAGTVTRTFVERMGSYSSESNFQNVDDVLGLVTAQLGAQLTKDAEKARAQSPKNGGYYGISTAYIGAKNIAESDTSMTLLVQTQREESFGSPADATVRYQTIEVTLVKEEEGGWKVSAYTWGD